MLSTGSSQRQYDANGNLTESTGRHDVNILYNYLNLPREIVTCTDTIHYIYDATGNKWAEYYSGTQTFEKYYMGNFQYTNQNLDYIHNAYGRIRLKNDEYHYDYYLSDHLGNVRAVFTDNGAGNAELLQANSYYPFGMQFKQAPEYQVESNNYLYNGKELQQYGNLNTYDYGWRQYDAALGRWHVQDKLAESFPGYSPYNYVKNSPINYIDPNGMYPDSWQRPGETVVAYNIRMNSPELYNMMYSDGGGGSGGGAGFAYAGGHYGWVKYTQYWYSYLPENEGKKITYTFGERDYYKFEWVEGPNVAQGSGDRHSNADDLWNITMGGAGTLADVRSNGMHNSIYWVQKNGKVTLTKNIGNNYLLQRSNRIVGETLKNGKMVAKSLTQINIAYTATDYGLSWVTTGNIPSFGSGMDLFFTSVAAIPGAGWAVSGGYWIISAGSYAFTGKWMSEHMDNWVK